MLGSRTDYIFDAGSVNGTRYCNEILLPYVRLLGAMGLTVPFHGRQCTMSSHSSCRTAFRSEILNARSNKLDWPDLNPHRGMYGIFGANRLLRQWQASAITTEVAEIQGSFDWRRCKTDAWAATCLNNSLTPSFSAWADAVKPA
ncbi:hypothetical protein TNCV_2563511 [Trichonephila clavipes]|nr:hypothetical protein TNCV_2563511 [Trichonephila clavipes]